jgi:serine/threonine protein kinase/WD40 repeat protein/tetratricopeptide (TPR) repeat protein
MNPPSEHDPLAPLADEFLERTRRGEKPSPQEYAANYPELATQIRDLFPALLVMENLGASVGGGTSTAHFSSSSPSRLGEYRILRQIGRGGMGVVYEAVQETLGRHVAVKVLPAHLAGRGKFLERFRREAKAAARLHHSNIVPVFGVGESDGLHFYAMQFIHGQALDKVLDDVRRLRGSTGQSTVTLVMSPPSIAQSLVLGQLEPSAADAIAGSIGNSSQVLSGTRSHYCREVARLGAQVADGLAYAHAQGVLHRDVKPANLLLDAQGTLWITDFGLAKAEDSDAITEAGDVIGTLRYMAPERFDGQSDARSDVYGLGATLYEMLALRPAFEDLDRGKLIGRITRVDPLPLRNLDPAIPRDLETVVLKAMARDPADRYPSATELAEDLRRFMTDRPILARRHSTREQAVRWARRNRGVAALTATVAVLLITITIGAIAYSVGLGRALDRETSALTSAKNAKRELTLQLYNARVAEARAGRLSRRIGQKYATLEAIREAAQLARELDLPESHRDELRNLAIAALVLPDLRTVEEPLPKTASSLHLSNDFSVAIEPGADATGVFSNVRQGKTLPPEPKSGPTIDATVRVTPSGRFAAVWAADNPRKFRLWEITPTKAKQIFESDSVFSAAFDPNGERIVICHVTGRMALVECATGKEVHSIKVWSSPLPFVMAVDPTGRRLAACRGDRVDVVDIASGSEVTVLRQSVTIVPGLAWHPAGNILAVSADDCKVHAWDLRVGKPVVAFEGLSSHGIRIAFNPRGDRLVGCDWSGDVRFWDARTGLQLLRADGTFWAPAFRADERRFAGVLDVNQGLQYEIAPERGYATLVRDTASGKSDYWWPATSPDGRWLAVGMDDGVSVWDLHTDEPAAFLPIGLVRHVSFGNDGSLYTGTHHLIRWPIRQTGSASWRIGPPEPWGNANRGCVGVSSDGQVVATAFPTGLEIVDRRRPGRVVRTSSLPDVRSIDVSPDGRLVAMGAFWGLGVKIVDSSTGRDVAFLASTSGGHHVQFSPDGKWLTTSGGALRLWNTSNWQELRLERPIGALPAFTQDGSIVAAALAQGSGWIGLFNVATGKEIARLEDPHGNGVAFLRFSHDGGILAAVNKRGFVVQRWDLRVIRSQLAEIGLDWDSPPLPPPPAVVAEYRPPPKVDVVDAEVAANASRLAVEDRTRWVIRLWNNPLDSLAHFRLGMFQFEWHHDYAGAHRHFSTAVALGLRDARTARAVTSLMLNRLEEAVVDVNEVFQFDTRTTTLLSVRGNSLRKLGRYQEAISDFTAMISQEGPAWQPLDWRAACYEAIGDAERAAADRAELLRIHPTAPDTLNESAWRLLTGPNAARDSTRALDIASRAAKLRPGDAVILNTLGVAQYRNGQFAEAIATLKQSRLYGKDEHAGIDLLFMAMCYQKLGQIREANLCFDQAMKWTNEATNLSPSQSQELAEFRREAENVLRPR